MGVGLWKDRGGRGLGTASNCRHGLRRFGDPIHTGLVGIGRAVFEGNNYIPVEEGMSVGGS